MKKKMLSKIAEIVNKQDRQMLNKKIEELKQSDGEGFAIALIAEITLTDFWKTIAKRHKH